MSYAILITFLIQTIASFIGASAMSVIFNAPKRLLIPCGTVGVGGWLVYYFMAEANYTMVVATFAGAFILAIVAHVFARYYKRPVIVFYFSGIIPLVPGGKAYEATKKLIINEFDSAIHYSIEALLISGAIAFGLLIAEIVVQFFLKAKIKLQTK